MATICQDVFLLLLIIIIRKWSETIEFQFFLFRKENDQSDYIQGKMLLFELFSWVDWRFGLLVSDCAALEKTDEAKLLWLSRVEKNVGRPGCSEKRSVRVWEVVVGLDVFWNQFGIVGAGRWKSLAAERWKAPPPRWRPRPRPRSLWLLNEETLENWIFQWKIIQKYRFLPHRFDIGVIRRIIDIAFSSKCRFRFTFLFIVTIVNSEFWWFIIVFPWCIGSF